MLYEYKLASLTWIRPSASNVRSPTYFPPPLGMTLRLSSRRKPGSPLMHEKGTLRLCLHRTLTWPFRNVRFAVRHSPPLSLAIALLLSRCPYSASCHADEGQHRHSPSEPKDGYSTITQRTEKPLVLYVYCEPLLVKVLV